LVDDLLATRGNPPSLRTRACLASTEETDRAQWEDQKICELQATTFDARSARRP
jgi:hypothetical protein